MSGSETLLMRLAGELEAAAATIRELAAASSATTPSVEDAVPVDDLVSVSGQEWLDAALAIHPMLGQRQTQVLLEVAKAYPNGVGTGPIWRAINYEQPNTYLALDALARQGLVRKDSTVKPHRYHVGDVLLRQVRAQRNR